MSNSGRCSSNETAPTSHAAQGRACVCTMYSSRRCRLQSLQRHCHYGRASRQLVCQSGPTSSSWGDYRLDLMSLISPRPSAAQNVGGGAMDSGVAPHSRGALISFCAGLLLAAPFRCRWPAFPLFRAASPCGLCPVARRPISLWHAFYFISESTGMPRKRTRCGECLN